MVSDKKQEVHTHKLGIYLWIWGLLFVFSFFSYMVDYMNYQGLLRWSLIVFFMLAKGGFIPSLSGFSPKGTSVKSLEQSGFDDTFQKNISSKLEDDFAIPDSLKRAFGEAMELPLRASAAMISDLISKIPAQDSNTKSIINESLSEVANAFHLSKTNLTNEVSSSDSSETTGGNSFVNSLSNVVSSTSSIQIADASRGRKNLNLLNPFDWPQILEEGGKARSGTRTNTEGNKLSVPTNILNRNNTC